MEIPQNPVLVIVPILKDHACQHRIISNTNKSSMPSPVYYTPTCFVQRFTKVGLQNNTPAGLILWAANFQIVFFFHFKIINYFSIQLYISYHVYYYCTMILNYYPAAILPFHSRVLSPLVMIIKQPSPQTLPYIHLPSVHHIHIFPLVPS